MNTNIEKIKILYSSLNTLRKEEYCFVTFDRIVSEILIELDILIEAPHNLELKNEYINISYHLSHTSDKEVEFIKYAQEKMLKRNTPKIREIEYFVSINDAIHQIESDLYPIIHG